MGRRLKEHFHGAPVGAWVQHLEQDDVDYVLESADRIHAQPSAQVELGSDASRGGEPSR